MTCANASFLAPLTRYHRPYALTACEPVALVVLSEAAALAAVRHAGHVRARQWPMPITFADPRTTAAGLADMASKSRRHTSAFASIRPRAAWTDRVTPPAY